MAAIKQAMYTIEHKVIFLILRYSTHQIPITALSEIEAK